MRSAVYWGAPLPARRARTRRSPSTPRPSRAPGTWPPRPPPPTSRSRRALEEAARAAERRGALAAATEAFERAGRLSPAGARVRRRSEGARTAVLAGRLDVARHTLDDLLTEPHDATVHADLELMRATVMLLGGEPLAAYELLIGEAGRIEPHDRPRAAALLSAAGIALLVGGHVRDLHAVAERARELAGPDADLVPTVLLAEALAAAGDVEPARELLLGREEELLAFGAHPGPVQELVVIAAFALAILEEWPRAERLLDGLIAGARRAGAVRALAFPLAVSAGLDVRRGHWSRARRKGREALPIAEETSPGFALTYAIATLAFLDAAQGRERSCRELAARLERVAAEFELPAAWAFSATTSGLLDLGLGRIDAAVAHLEQAVAHIRGLGPRAPGLPSRGGVPDRGARAGAARPRGARTAGRAGGARAAVRGLVAARQRGARARPAGAGGLRRALRRGARVLRRSCPARSTSRAPSSPGASACAASAAAPRPARSSPPRSRASTVSGLGHGRARTGRAGRRRGRPHPLGRGADEAPLTHKEGEVADLVAAGATNREAAAALFLSPRTVEHHLRQVYRKLGVRSRTELAAAYGAREVTPRPPADRNR